MPQRRARRCSASAAVASLVIRSFSQLPSVLSVIFEPREVNHPIAFLDPQFDQRRAVAGAADAAPARRLVGGAVGRAQQVAAVGIEKYPVLPVEFHRDVRAAVQVAVGPSILPDHKGGGLLAEVL